MPRREGAERDWSPSISVRVPRDVLDAAKAKAAGKGETLTDVVVRGLRRYGRS